MKDDLFEVPGEGEKLRDEGAERVSRHNRMFHDHAMHLIGLLATYGKPFGPDDLRSLLKIQPRHPNAIGAVFLAARRKGIIRRIGRKKNPIVSAHAREVNVYIGV